MGSFTRGHVNVSGSGDWSVYQKGRKGFCQTHSLFLLYILYWITSIHELSLVQLNLRNVTSAQDIIHN